MGARGPKPGSVPKPEGAGRKAGTPNKRTLEMVSKLEELGLDPIAEWVWCMREAKECYLEAKRQPIREFDPKPAYLKILSDSANNIAKFMYPTRKAVDHTSGGQSFSSLVDVMKAVLGPEDGSSGSS